MYVVLQLSGEMSFDSQRHCCFIHHRIVANNFLQVGGIKEKVLAAHRAGVEQVIMPKRCEKDLHEVPDAVKVGVYVAVSLASVQR